MPRRNKRKAKGAEPGTLGAGGGKGGPGENWGGEHMRQAPTPLIAVNPDRTLIAVAFGTEVRVYDTETGALATLASVCAFDAAAAAAREGGADAPDASRWHTDAIRALRFDSTGASMCTAGDDKLARVWRVEKADGTTPASADVVPSPRTLTCVRCARLPKKACAAAFFSASDGVVAAFADKFGDVHGLPVTETPFKGDVKVTFDEATYLLGHCCSIITDACAVSGEGSASRLNLLATADRDFKIRVARLPDATSTILNPAIGVPEIQSFCHGHAAFVACVAAVPSSVGGGEENAYVVSGGGDGAAKLWRCEDGEEVGSVTLAPPRRKKVSEDGDGDGDVFEKGKAHVVMDSGEAPREAVDAPAVVAVAVAANGDVYASVEEREGHVAKLRVSRRHQEGDSASSDASRLSLELVEWVDLRGEGVEGVPSSLHYDETRRELVGVCERKKQSARGRDGEDGATTEAALFFAFGAADAADAADAAFDRARCSRALAVAGMAEASTGVSLGDAMRKRSYDEQRREERKKQRNDFKSGGASLSNL